MGLECDLHAEGATADDVRGGSAGPNHLAHGLVGVTDLVLCDEADEDAGSQAAGDAVEHFAAGQGAEKAWQDSRHRHNRDAVGASGDEDYGAGGQKILAHDVQNGRVEHGRHGGLGKEGREGAVTSHTSHVILHTSLFT